MNHKSLLWLFILFFASHINAATIDAKKYATNNHKGFTENKGQIIDQNNNPNPAVKYLFNSNGLNIQLRANGFSYDVWKAASGSKPLASGKNIEQNNFLPKARSQELIADSLFSHRIDFEFENANADIKIISENQSSDYTNYYTTGTPKEGVINIRNYQKVIYKNVWNGIDIVFLLSTNNHQLNLNTISFYNPEQNFRI